MNKAKYLLIAAVGLGLALVSCNKEEYVPGEADEKDCFGVYFPAGQGGTISLDPEEAMELEFTAARTIENGDITVPVTVAASEDIFTIGKIEFADGQTETTFKVSFPKAELSKDYSCTISLTDRKYVSSYGVNPVSIDFTVSRVKWERVLGANGEEYGSWRDDFICGLFNNTEYVFNDKVEVYERADKKGYYRLRNIYNKEYLCAIAPWDSHDEDWTPGIYNEIDATNPAKIYIPLQSIGVDFGYGTMTIGTFCPENGLSMEEYGVFEDGVLTFPTKGLVVSDSEGMSYANTSGKFAFILPGAVLKDYSIAIELGEVMDGDLPIDVVLGADVTTAVYQIYDGKLDDGEIYENRTALESDSDAKTVNLENPSITVSGMATGYYTIIAVSFDKDGKPSKNAAETFSYIAKGEEVPVVLSCGVGSAEKYVPRGYSTDNTIEFYVYGKDLTEVRIVAAKKSDIVGNMKAVVKSLASAKAVDKDVLKAINGTGYVGIISALLPGTEYQLVVYASNGYEENIVVSESSVTTTGDPLPIYDEFTVDSIKEELLPEKSEGYFGKYNFYAVDKNKKVGLREYISKVTIADSEVPDSEPDEDGLIDEYLDFSGMFSRDLNKDEKFDDTMVWDFYGGLIYSVAQPLGQYSNYWLSPFITEKTHGPFRPDYDGLLLGGFVDEGYIAIMGDPYYYEKQGLLFDGIAMIAYGDKDYSTPLDQLLWYTDLLLVEESKDDNGVAPSAKAVSGINELHAVSEMARTLPFNYVETRRGHIRSIIDAAKTQGKVKLYGVEQGFVGERTVTVADFTVSPRQAAKAEKNGHRINGLKIVEK